VRDSPILLGQFSPAISPAAAVCYRLIDDGDQAFTLPDMHKPELAVRRSLDRELIPQYNPTVLAGNCGNNSKTSCQAPSNTTHYSNRVTIVVEVEDVNDCVPRFTQRSYFGKIM